MTTNYDYSLTSYALNPFINLHDALGANITSKQRAKCFCFAPVAFIGCAIDIVLGIGIGIAAFIATPLGADRITWIAYGFLEKSRCLFTLPFAAILLSTNIKIDGLLHESETTISMHGDGFLANQLLPKLKNYAEACTEESETRIKQWAVSRLTYAVRLCASLATRTVDGAIAFLTVKLVVNAVTRVAHVTFAVIAVFLGTALLSNFDSFNHIAFRTLQAPAVVFDLFYCAIHVLNPLTPRV
jgi:hypothetical protein